MTDWCQDFPRTKASFPLLEVLPTADSTNRVVSARDTVSDECVVVLTSHQTAGRGRLGRQWQSRPGESLALSVLFPQLSPSHLPWFPLVTGACLVRALRLAGVTQAQMKWPNDVLVEGGKLAGILCESLPSGRVVAGIGLNIEFPGDDELVPGSVALSAFAGVTHALVDSIVCETLVHLRLWSESAPHDAESEARALVDPVLATLGQQVSIHEMDGEVWSGAAEGLSPQGHLLVTTPAGEARVVVASDVRHLRQ
jgi:BirA family transcriptional regulator, biotin operon repressor / biotin---[acetyl-CoA-carboxylase] ligase